MIYIDRNKEKEATMRPNKPFLIYLYVLGVGLILATTGIILFCVSTIIYEAIISNNMILYPGSTAYDIWLKNPIPLDFNLYLFNWTNPEHIYNYTNIKPKFNVVGPFVYAEMKEKTNITWNANDTVTYRNKKTWNFLPEKSNGSLSDLVTNVNPIALSAAYTSRFSGMVTKNALSMGLRMTGEALASTHKVSEILFEGYVDSLLKLSSMTYLFKPDIPVMERFGWFYGRNGSIEFDGVFNADTGSSGHIGRLREWNYANRTRFFPDECGAFDDSSAGDFFPNKLTKQSIVKLFSSDLCRYIELEFEKEVVVQGIVGYKFAAFDRFLDNGTKVPENKCFCDGNCMPSGALNVSTCRLGSPSFISLPHFYKADPSYLAALDGLHPDPKKHDFYMIFEPKTGIPLQVSARLQINLKIERIEGINQFSNAPDVYMPVLYFEQSVTIPEEMTFLIKLLVNFEIICAAVASIFLSLGVFTSLFMCYKLCSTNIFGNDKKSPEKIPEEVPLNK